MGECDRISATMKAKSQNFIYNLKKTNFAIKNATKAFLLENDGSILYLETTDIDVTRVLVAEVLINLQKDDKVLNEILFTNFSDFISMSLEQNEDFLNNNFPDLFVCVLDNEEQLNKQSSLLESWINIVKVNGKKIIFIVQNPKHLEKSMMDQEMVNIFKIKIDKLWKDDKIKENNQEICAIQTEEVTNESISERALDESSDVIIKEEASSETTNLHDEVKDENADLINLLQSLGVEELDAVDEDGNTQLHLAAENGKMEIVQSLLRLGAKKDVKNNDGETALHLAAWEGQRAIVQMLLEHGFNVHAIENINQGTPLHFACYYQNDALLVEILLKFGADMERKDSYGKTALHLASFNGRSAVVNSLLRNGAKINVQNNYGNTPLHDSTSNNKPEIVSILLQHGALFNIKNKQQKNALDEAKHRKHTEIIQIFQNHK